MVFTNSPATTQETLNFNLLPERVVELPLGIDSNDGVNGLLVNPMDISDIKAAILRFVDPDCRKTMGDEGIKFSAPFS